MAVRSLIAEGSADGVDSLYNPDVELVAYLPGEVTHAHGRQDAARSLGSWHGTPAAIASWEVQDFAGEDGRLLGADIDVEFLPSGSDTALRRRHYLILNSEGLIDRHTIFPARPYRHSPPSGEPGPRLEAVLSRATSRVLVGGGYSGSYIEKVVPDGGPPVVIKYLTPESDWHAQSTNGAGREALLFLGGTLDQLPAGVSHAVLAAEPYGSGWAVISRDLTDHLLARPADLATIRSYLSGLRDMHLMAGEPRQDAALATLAERWGLWWPTTLAAQFHDPDTQPKQVARGWDILDQVVPEDVGAVVRQVAYAPDPVIGALEEYGRCLLHGDAHLGNVARDASGFVLLDWGLATTGPPAVEAAWLANFAQQYTCSVDEILTAVGDLWGLGRDSRALKLALVGQASSVIPALTSAAVDYPDPAHRRFTQTKLAWWVAAVRSGADVLP